MTAFWYTSEANEFLAQLHAVFLLSFEQLHGYVQTNYANPLQSLIKGGHWAVAHKITFLLTSYVR